MGSKLERDRLMQLQDLTLVELQTLQTQVTKRIVELSNDDIYAFIYTLLLERLATSGRYTDDQSASIKPWQNLPKTKQKEFKMAWLACIATFVTLGFVENTKLRDFIINLLVTSQFLKQLKYDLILISLDRILTLLELNFPGYRVSGAMQVLIEQLK